MSKQLLVPLVYVNKSLRVALWNVNKVLRVSPGYAKKVFRVPLASERDTTWYVCRYENDLLSIPVKNV